MCLLDRCCEYCGERSAIFKDCFPLCVYYTFCFWVCDDERECCTGKSKNEALDEANAVEAIPPGGSTRREAAWETWYQRPAQEEPEYISGVNELGETYHMVINKDDGLPVSPTIAAFHAYNRHLDSLGQGAPRIPQQHHDQTPRSANASPPPEWGANPGNTRASFAGRPDPSVRSQELAGALQRNIDEDQVARKKTKRRKKRKPAAGAETYTTEEETETSETEERLNRVQTESCGGVNQAAIDVFDRDQNSNQQKQSNSKWGGQGPSSTMTPSSGSPLPATLAPSTNKMAHQETVV